LIETNPTIYVALLRGINVGGKNKVNMKLLKQTFERVGMCSVMTYINSGNIIFTDKDHPESEISEILEKAISEDFGLNIKVVVRSYDDLKIVVETIPESWQNNKEMKSDVMFLWNEIDNASILEKLVIKPDIDTVSYVPGAILWKVESKNITKSGKMKLGSSKLYKQMTVRNVNTVRKVWEIMEGLKDSQQI